MSAHTPGPWLVFAADHMANENEGDGYFFTVGPREFHTVALVRPGNSDDGLPEQSPANARLIAAAPDLLNIAQAVAAMHVTTFDEFTTRFGFSKSNIENAAMDVIARATGKEPS